MQVVNAKKKVYLFQEAKPTVSHLENYLKGDYFEWQNDLETMDKRPTTTKFTGRARSFSCPAEAYAIAGLYPALKYYRAGWRTPRLPDCDSVTGRS